MKRFSHLLASLALAASVLGYVVTSADTASAQAAGGNGAAPGSARGGRRRQPLAGRGGFRGGFPGGGGGGLPGFGGAGRGPAIPAGIQVQTNVPYVEKGNPNEVVDIYYPEQPEKPLPLMIWIHGGAWLGGSQANPPCLFLLSHGYAVASVQHTFSGQAKWPQQAYDVKAAVRFLRANAAKYHVDPDRFGVGGDSSGGHLAAFLGTSGGVKDMEGTLGNNGVSSSVQVVVDWFGPTDLLSMGKEALPTSVIQHDSASSPESMLLGGPVQEKKELAISANPITYVNPKDPPFLIMHGDNDTLVPHGQSVELAKALSMQACR